MMSSVSPPAPSLPSGGGSFFRGYTKLCKGLAVILLLVHLLVQLFPSAVNYLALIPARTIPFAWNLITAGYVEQTIPGVIISIIGLLLFGKLLEPLWGTKELSKFVFIVNFSTSMCVFVTAIAVYYVTQQESYLYTPLSGFYGVLSGLLVGIKQLMPEMELNLFVLKIKGKGRSRRVHSRLRQVYIDMLKEQLLDVDTVPGRALISITGESSIGKTTLARKVYQSPEIRNHFAILHRKVV